MTHRLSVIAATTALIGLAAGSAPAEPLRVGVYVDRRSQAVDEIVRTLNDAGMAASTFEKTSFEQIYDYDVVYFGGGYQGYNWADLNARLHIVEYVQQRGGGVVLSMFRTGSPGRVTQRPMFPEVADSYHKINSPAIFVTDSEHPITAGLPAQFQTPCWDHACLRLGASGRKLAVDANGEVAMACGQVGLGRVVFLGPWLGLDVMFKPMYPLADTDRAMLLNSVRWAAAGAPQATEAKPGPVISETVRLKVLRREKALDWSHDERGKTWYIGILARARNEIETQLDDLSFRAGRLAPHAADITSAGALLKVQQTIAELQQELHTEYDRAVRERGEEIGRLSVEELEAETVRDLTTARRRDAQDFTDEQIARWQFNLMNPARIEPVAADIARLESVFAPWIEQDAASAFDALCQRDAEQVPALLASLADTDAGIRAESALELGRIGDARAEEALIARLHDPVYEVRRNAIYALAWMQSREAIEPLLELTRSDDPWTRRRATQALGQIGDTSAVKPLLALTADPDPFVRQNAILGLGWLGDPAAVPRLCKLVRAYTERLAADTGNAGDLAERLEVTCAMRALGHIGDASAKADLNALKAAQPKESLPGHFPPLGIGQAVDAALAELTAGGRRTAGIAQPAFLRKPENFYWVGGQYNAFHGRYFTWGNYPTDPKVMADYAAASGASGLIQFRTAGQIEQRRPGGDDYVPHFSKLGLKHVVGSRAFSYQPIDKAGFEQDLLRWGHEECLAGFWAEEALGFDLFFRQWGNIDRAFADYLRRKYSDAERLALDIGDLGAVRCPVPDSKGQWSLQYDYAGARSNKVLFAEYAEFLAERGVPPWREAAEWLSGLRKGMALMFSLSQRYVRGGSTYIRAYPQLCGILGATGPQSYGAHSMANNFHLDMHVDGESRPALGEFYQMDADTVGRVERGFASSFLHGQSFFVWWWGHTFKHAPDTNGGTVVWDKGRWEAAVRQFRKGKAVSEYLAPARTASPKLVTQLYSGRTTTLTYGRGRLDGHGGYSSGGRIHRYTQHQQALWESLIQSHVPIDMTWLETQSAAKLAQYKVAVLSDAWSLHPDEIAMVREWVRNGGVLIATGGTTRHDQWDRPLPNYALADVFGADFVSNEMRDATADMHSYVELDLKPTQGIVTLAVGDDTLTAHMEGATNAECDRGLGTDGIRPTTGKVVGTWGDGSPAVIENTYGKGACLFLTPIWPALSHRSTHWTVDDLYKAFWPGARELIAGCVRRGLTIASAKLPVDVHHCPPTVEVALKQQDRQSRWIVHLLNIDPAVRSVEHVEVTVGRPDGKMPKAVVYVYPARRPVVHETEAGRVRFTVRPFAVHEMVVLEYD